MAADPLRDIVAGTPRVDIHNKSCWGYVLDCGHYVESDDLVKQIECPDCQKGCYCIPTFTIPCTVCKCPDGKRRYGATIPCPACYEFGQLEIHLQHKDLMTGPAPLTLPTDYMVAYWLMNEPADNALTVTVVVKRGKSWLGERRVAVPYSLHGRDQTISRFIPSLQLSARGVAQQIEQIHEAHAYNRRVFIEIFSHESEKRLSAAQDLMSSFVVSDSLKQQMVDETAHHYEGGWKPYKDWEPEDDLDTPDNLGL